MSKFDQIQKVLEEFLAIGPSGCSMTVSRGSDILFQTCVGEIDPETKAPMTPDAIFRIFSMTKVITCTAALTLYEKGLYLLNDPISEYMPEFKDMLVCDHTVRGDEVIRPAKKPITVKDLFTMGTGYPYPSNRSVTGRALMEIDQNQPLRDYVRAISEVPLCFDPGTHWYYGLSHDILGAFIEVVSGMKFSEYLKKAIFDPLEMTDTFFRLPPEKAHRLAAMCIHEPNEPIRKAEERPGRYSPDAVYESGGGGLLSTLGDYTRFTQMLAQNGTRDGVRILGKKTIDLMRENHLNDAQYIDFTWPYQAGYSYGLGVRTMIDKPYGGCNGSYGEFGWCGAAGTWMFADPSENLSAVYMHQLSGDNKEAYIHPRLRAMIYGALD
ncbi:MAG: beta-lactamase family protein [Christensenellaceae bacterium]|nr:beta-lactamase family protein [Christensenellaceae bacterium]